MSYPHQSDSGYRRRQERVVIAGDGTTLYARQTMGPGASGIPLICANGIGVSTIFWRFVEDHFSPSRPVVVWDYRGHGRSEHPRDLNDLTMEANADDMCRVLDAFGYRQAILLGHSMGCQVIYTFAHRHPERTRMLVPMLGAYGRPIHTFLDREVTSMVSFLVSYHVGLGMPRLVNRAKRRLFGRGRARGLVSRLARLSGLVHAEKMPQSCLDDYLDHFASLSPVVLLRMAEKMAQHTSEPYLEQIHHPTLVVAGRQDLFAPFYLSEEAAARLPQSRLFTLDDGSHAALVEQPHLIHAEIDRFLREHELDQADFELLDRS